MFPFKLAFEGMLKRAVQRCDTIDFAGRGVDFDVEAVTPADSSRR
jgi:hypothetical protein